MTIQQEVRQKENVIQNYWKKGKKDSQKPTGQNKDVNEIKIKEEVIELSIKEQTNLTKERNNIALEFGLTETKNESRRLECIVRYNMRDDSPEN